MKLNDTDMLVAQLAEHINHDWVVYIVTHGRGTADAEIKVFSEENRKYQTLSL